MRAVTKAAMVDAVRLFVAAWRGQPTEQDWRVVAEHMETAWSLHSEDVENAAGGGFDGAYYDPAVDDERLQNQLGRVWQCMSDGQYRALAEIARICEAPPASVSAQLRHLRKRKHGSWIIDSTAQGDRGNGLFVYRMRNPDGTVLPPIMPLARRPAAAR